jgi:hypothetical protein
LLSLFQSAQAEFVILLGAVELVGQIIDLDLNLLDFALDGGKLLLELLHLYDLLCGCRACPAAPLHRLQLLLHLLHLGAQVIHLIGGSRLQQGGRGHDADHSYTEVSPCPR